MSGVSGTGQETLYDGITGQKFERRDIELGISDGVYAEVLGGISEGDNIKVWNKTEPLKRGDVDEQEFKYDN